MRKSLQTRFETARVRDTTIIVYIFLYNKITSTNSVTVVFLVIWSGVEVAKKKIEHYNMQFNYIFAQLKMQYEYFIRTIRTLS